jgi:type I restriction enzyme M protein
MTVSGTASTSSSFLKMADERGIDLSGISYQDDKGRKVEVDCSWPEISSKSGLALTHHYVSMLIALGRQKDLLGAIFSKAVSKFTNPVNLKKLIGVIDETEWTSLDIDIKAAAFEGLLEKAASEGKKGAGQYLTPRILIQSVVRCVKPDPRAHAELTISDPACGTGGFLVSSYEWLIAATKGGAMDRALAKRIKKGTYFGQELVDQPRRLALMNLYLHGLEPQIKGGDSIYESPDSRRFDIVLTNPPFGTKGANQVPEREDFTIATSNKQLNFLQHVLTILKPGGRAAVVVPDNCLFADQAGDVFEILMKDCNLHTVLRLPNGTFSPYSPGTKTDRPLTPEYFKEFEKFFGSDPNGRAKRKPSDSKEDRWRSFDMEEVKARNYKIDGLKWLKGESLDDMDDLPEPEELATDAIAELEAAVEELNAVIAALENGNGSGNGNDKAKGLARAKRLAEKA